MDGLAIARAVHVLALVHWIGGLAMVTLVILPSLLRVDDPGQRLALFEAVEGRFSRQARISVLLVGLSGFYMTWRYDAWSRFADPQYWWMHAMVCLWALFTVMLFVAEPLFLHRWFAGRTLKRPDPAFRFALRAHQVVLAVSSVTIAGAVVGVHGAWF